MEVNEVEISTIHDQEARLLAQLQAARDAKFRGTLVDNASAVESLPPLALKPRRTLTGHLTKVSAVHWSGDSQRLVSASHDGRVIVWNAFTKLKEQLVVFSTGNRNVQVELRGHEGYISGMRFVDDSRVLTSSGDMTCRLWDVNSGKEMLVFRGHRNDATSVDVCPTNRSLFTSGGCDATARVWDARTGTCVQAFLGHQSDVNSVQFHPEGGAIGTGSDDASCRLFDMRAGRDLVELSSDMLRCAVTSVAFSTSGRLLFAAYEEHNCIVWDVLKARRLALITGHTHRVSGLAVAPDGSALATAAWDCLVKIWA